MNEQSRASTAVNGNATAPKETAAKAVAGPLTIRDLGVLAGVVIIFVASLIPIINTLAGSFSLWNTSGLFYLGVGVILPLAVGALFLIRRMSPTTRIRFGSLSVDQFASVVAAFATFFFFAGTVTNFTIAYLVGLIGALLLLVTTACAQWIPVLAADFAGRAEVPAHIAARDGVPALKRPAAPKPVVAQAGAAGQAFGQQGAPAQGGTAHFMPGQQGGNQQGAGQQTPGQQGAPVQSGWNATPAASAHSQGGQIFTPAKDSAAGTGFGAGAAASAAAGAVNAANPAAAAANAGNDPIANPYATNPYSGNSGAASNASAAGNTAGNTGAANAGTGNSPSGANSANTPSANTGSTNTASNSPTANTTQQASVESSAPAKGSDTQAHETVATTLNPQVVKGEKPAAAGQNQAVPAPVKESITATVNPAASAAVVAEPFWFAVDRPQNVIDEKTRQFAFKLAPGAWILALEDRGSSFLVQDSHGKTGLLLDLVGIERASDSQ